MKPHSSQHSGKRSKKRRTAVSVSREVALDVLESVREGRFAEHELNTRLQRPDLSPEDRALATELSYGVLRWRSRLDSIVDRCLARPNKPVHPTVRDILRIALYQSILLSRIPHRAAVHEAVTQARNRLNEAAAGFVNGILRNALRNLDTMDRVPSDDPESLAAYYSFPVWLVSRWLEEFGAQATRRILSHGNSRSRVVIRVNPLKTTHTDLLELFSRESVSAHPTIPEPDALRLESVRGAVADIPGFAHGLFAVQDPASQLIAPLLQPRPGERILDACAAPGGKTAHLAALTMNEALITAVDEDETRLRDTGENLQRLGVTCARLRQADVIDAASVLDLGTFDKILVDAPCSNLGVVRHNPEVKYRITPARLAKLAERQLQMLTSAASVLEPGGTMVYSVCTVTREETTEVIDRFLEAHPRFSMGRIEQEEVRVPDVVHRSGFLLTFPPPDDARLDGFFAARLKKS